MSQMCLLPRHVKICHTREQLAALPPGPKAILATLPSLEAGPAQELLVDWAGDPHSLILFTERPPVMIPRHEHCSVLHACCCKIVRQGLGIDVGYALGITGSSRPLNFLCCSQFLPYMLRISA